MTTTLDDIESLIEKYEKEVAIIKHDSLRMVWGMRGGVTYSEVINMSADERKIIADIIDENMETAKKTQLPFF